MSDGSYDGLRAELYDLLEGGQNLGDGDFYRAAVERNQGLALEVGCGTGRLLLPFLKSGLSVHGVDASAAMLVICSRKAGQEGLSPVIYHQSMQSLNLPNSYQTIYVPFFSFQFLYKWQEAVNALHCFYKCLASNGQILIAVYVPRRDALFSYKNLWQLRLTATRPSDGATVFCHRASSYDFIEQIETNCYKYEVCNEGRITETYCQTVRTRCYGKYELKLMLESIGFKEVFIYGGYSDSEAMDTHSVMVASGRKIISA